MPDIRVEIRGLKEFEKAAASGSLVAKRAVAKALFSSAIKVQGKVKEYAPVKTGNLRRSITYQLYPSKAVVGTTAKYASFLEFGTRDHGPKRANFLVFKSNGRWVRTKRVKGIKARRFFQRGLEASRTKIIKYFDAALEELQRHLAD